jgi:ATP-dependent protease ClpP protease subunit
MNIIPISDTGLTCSGEIGYCRNYEGELEPCDDFTPLAYYLLGAFRGVNVTLYLMSGGGNAYVGEGLAGLIRQHGRVTVVGCGIVGSAATFMFLAGKRCYLDASASMFIHEASNICWGTKGVHQQMAQDLAALDNQIANKYVDQIELTSKLINGSREETLAKVVDMMNKSTTLNATSAFDLGMCDGYYNVSGKLVKQPKEKPMDTTVTGEPASDPMPIDMGKMPDKAKNAFAASATALIQKYEGANIPNVKHAFQNFLGVTQNAQNNSLNQMDTNPIAPKVEQPATNPAQEVKNEVATPEQKAGFFAGFLNFLGINTAPKTETAPTVQNLAPATAPAIEAPATVTPAAPTNTAPAVETAPVAPVNQPIAQPTAPEPVNQLPKPQGAQDVLNDQSAQKPTAAVDYEALSPMERLKAMAQFRDQCLNNRASDNHPDTLKAIQGLKDAALNA